MKSIPAWVWWFIAAGCVPAIMLVLFLTAAPPGVADPLLNLSVILAAFAAARPSFQQPWRFWWIAALSGLASGLVTGVLLAWGTEHFTCQRESCVSSDRFLTTAALFAVFGLLVLTTTSLLASAAATIRRRWKSRES